VKHWRWRSCVSLICRCLPRCEVHWTSIVSDHRRDNCESKQQNKTTDATTQYIYKRHCTCRWTPICNFTCWHTCVHTFNTYTHTQMNNAENVLKTYVWYPQPWWLEWSSWHHVYHHHTTVQATPSDTLMRFSRRQLVSRVQISFINLFTCHTHSPVIQQTFTHDRQVSEHHYSPV